MNLQQLAAEAIQLMPAGPEMDLLVASVIAPAMLKSYRCYQSCPPYSTDGNAMLEMLAYLQQKYWVKVHVEKDKDDVMVVLFRDFWEDDEAGIATAPTLPLAVCRAALLMESR